MLVFRSVFFKFLFKSQFLFLSLLIVTNFTKLVGDAPKLGTKKVVAKSGNQSDSLDNELSDSDELNDSSAPVDQNAGVKKSDTELAAEIDQVLNNLAAANLDPDKYSFLKPSAVEPMPAILQKSHALDGELDFDLDF